MEPTNQESTTKTQSCKAGVVGSFYNVNIIGVGWLIAECGFSKYDFKKENPCLLIDDREVYEDDYSEIEFAF